MPESLQPALHEAFATGQQVRFHPGQALVLQGGPPDAVFLLWRGCTEVVRSDAEGRETFLTFRCAQEIVGEYAFIDGGPRSATVRAVSAVTAVRVGGRALRRHLELHPDVAGALHAHAVAKARQSAERAHRYGNGPAKARIARVLVDHADRYGCDDGLRRLIPVPLTYPRIADLAHCTPRTVTHHMTAWTRQGVIGTGRPLALVDLPRIAALAA